MDKLSTKQRRAFISYLDEKNDSWEGYVNIIRLDQFLVQFQTNNGSMITIPLARVLKIKEREEDRKRDGENRFIEES